MFKIQTDNHNFRKKDATDKKYILRKMGLKFQNPKFSISYIIALYIFFFIKMGNLLNYDVNKTIVEQAKMSE